MSDDKTTPEHDWIYLGTAGQRCVRCGKLASEVAPINTQAFAPCEGPSQITETWRYRQAKDAQRLMSGTLNKPPATEREERLEEALWRIAQWADAYPLAVFPEVDAEYHSRARKALEAGGMTLDRLSASAMRHVVQGVGKIAKEALSR